MNAWMALFTTIVGALLTGVLGNRLVQAWQHRNWRNQQQFAGLEKEYSNLRDLSENLLRDCGDRLAAMRDLRNALARGTWEPELERYRSSLRSWNGTIHSYYAQLRFQLDWNYTLELENRVHKRFYLAGQKIDEIIRARNKRRPTSTLLAEADIALNSVAASVSDFGSSLVRETVKRREEVFYGKKLRYIKSDIIRLTNVELIKLIFVSDIDSFAVVRPTVDVSSPLGRRV